MRALQAKEVSFVTGGGSEDDKQGGYGGFDFDYSNEGRGHERGLLDAVRDFIGDMAIAWLCGAEKDGTPADKTCVAEMGGYSWERQKNGS